jgi:transcription initiation factor IIE alpha subunit
MNELTSLLYSIPAPLPKKVRRVVAKEMRKAEKQPLFRRGTDYGTVQPRVLDFLKKNGPAEPNHIAEHLNMNKDSIRRGIRGLHKKKLIICVQTPHQGFHIPSIWKVVEEV